MQHLSNTTLQSVWLPHLSQSCCWTSPSCSLPSCRIPSILNMQQCPGLSQVAAVFPQGIRMVLGRDQMLCCPFISPWLFPDVLCVNRATSSSSFCWRAQQGRHGVPATWANRGWQLWFSLIAFDSCYGTAQCGKKNLWMLFYPHFFERTQLSFMFARYRSGFEFCL